MEMENNNSNNSKMNNVHRSRFVFLFIRPRPFRDSPKSAPAPTEGWASASHTCRDKSLACPVDNVSAGDLA